MHLHAFSMNVHALSMQCPCIVHSLCVVRLSMRFMKVYVLGWKSQMSFVLACQLYRKFFYFYLSVLKILTRGISVAILYSWHILFDSFCFLGGSGFHNPNYLEIKKDLTSKFHAQFIQNIWIGNFKTSWSSCYYSVFTNLKNKFTLLQFKISAERSVIFTSFIMCALRLLEVF